MPSTIRLQHTSSPGERPEGLPVRLVLFGGLLWLGCLALTRLSDRFAYGVPGPQRPVGEIVLLLLGMFVVYLLALRSAVSDPRHTAVWKIVLGYALGFRIVTLFSTPIQELDYYRYLWDGYTIREGVSPYAYTPQQVLTAAADDPSLPHDLQRLMALRDRDPRAATIAARVHYGDLPSIYPPVSLAVFTLSVVTTPATASIDSAVLVLKAWIVLFDVGTLLLLARILRHAGRPPGWALAYGWCPLIIKEFANTGHLDSIAVFLTVAAAHAVQMTLFPAAARAGKASLTTRASLAGRDTTTRTLAIGAAALGLAVGAKLYPVVLAPLFLLTVGRRRSVKSAIGFGAIFGAVAAASCAPMLTGVVNVEPPQVTQTPVTDRSAGHAVHPRPRSHVPPPHPGDVERMTANVASAPSIAPQSLFASEDAATRGPLAGSESRPLVSQPPQHSLKVFLSQWKMNDLLFAVLEENLSASKTPSDGPAPWFAVTPQSIRASLADRAVEWLHIPREQSAFLSARLLLAGVFIALAAWWAWSGSRSGDSSAWLKAVFLTLAWFWALSPTLNPWYWSWALPFVPFAGRRSWLLVSGLLSLYYLRYWFAYQWGEAMVAGTPYAGELFFHYVVVWFEHIPWMAALFVEIVLARRRRVCSLSQTAAAVDPIMTHR